MGRATAHPRWTAHLRPQEKQMEALYMLRFLKTQANRLRVLHFINAMVSIHVGKTSV
jgi:hypothetical protein